MAGGTTAKQNESQLQHQRQKPGSDNEKTKHDSVNDDSAEMHYPGRFIQM